ncbi:MAG: Calx-beta domain-containing protein [Saprospiraceae bacterium]
MISFKRTALALLAIVSFLSTSFSSHSLFADLNLEYFAEIPIVTIASDISTMGENDGMITITATLSTSTDIDVIIDFSTAGTAVLDTDYSMSSSSLTIPPGNTSGSITINGINDDVDETPTGDETIIVSVSAVANGIDLSSPINLTLTDDDVIPSFQLGTIAINEGDSGSIYASIPIAYPTSTGTISFLASVSSNSTATYNTDFTGDDTLTLIIPAGQRTSSNAIAINSIADGVYEGGPYEYIYFEASNPNNVDVTPWNDIFDSNGSSIFSPQADPNAIPCLNGGVVTYIRSSRGIELWCICTPYFTGTDCSQSSSLPVEWLDFFVTQVENDILLNWQVYVNPEAHYFEIQRSQNGRNWQSIGIQKITPEERGEQFYNWLDENAYPGINYYRIKQFDDDNSFIYSKVINLDFKSDEIFRVERLFPNPSKSRDINLSIFSLSEGDMQVTFFNMNQKKIVQSNKYKVSKGDQVVKLNLQSLPLGTYFAKIEYNNEVYIKQFILL